MEVMSPNQNKEDHFDFDFKRFSYLSAPSSPKRFGEAFYLSAPTSPSSFYAQFEDEDDDGFAFPVNREQDSSPRSAGELFDHGKIKPLESVNSPLLSPNRVKQSPIAKGKKAIVEAFSSKNKNDLPERRGRDRTPSSEFSTSKSGRRIIRSDSPFRKPQYTWIEEKQSKQSEAIKEESSESAPSSHSWKSSRIWRLKDFLLFRSASEGRGTSKDPFRKFPVSYNKKSSEEGKGSSSPFRSNIPKARRKEPVVSAHELHYARKKAENEDLKKKTFLPYKQGILGKLAGLGSSTR
ncbi:uncharacterized protein LOC131655336 [Vicia villosa]|uniref:uncharacterized protein LOC131655336 n=1 Tax=Vicia villosa TaxID=3911 RepID=UPI00273CBE3B|nr:uncharacterized protein LOC131655336 [Vicia villosa]